MQPKNPSVYLKHQMVPGKSIDIIPKTLYKTKME